MVEKKKITINFDLNIPKHDKAYQVLKLEQGQTGMSYSMIVHEALVVYAKNKGYIKYENMHVKKHDEVNSDTLTYSDNYSDLIN